MSSPLGKLSDGKRMAISMAMDLTGRKRAEEALKESTAALEKAQQIARIGSWEYDISTGKPTWSKQLFELFGRDPSLGEPSWQEHQTYIHPDDWNTLNAAVESGLPYDIEFRVLHPTEGVKWRWTKGQPIYDTAGKVVKLSGTVQDINERKQEEEELMKAKERAEESDRLKSAFLANMSHEIRTPMNGILGFADLLKEPMLTGEEQQEYIQIIEKSGNRMLNIINDIINISKIESGQMELSFSDTNIKDQIEFIYSFFKHEADQKGIMLSYNNLLPPSVTIIRTDREKLYAILTNLVKNAIKYTDYGAIEIGCNLKTNIDPTEPVSEPVELLYYIKDTGIGISQDKQVAIFDRFVQVDTSDYKVKQGAGLGLAITKAYVEMLGGQIWVESEIDKGSKFHFSIPFKPASNY
jgi:signal transduction histidine kinase